MMNTPKYSCAVDISRPIIPGFYPDPSIVRVGNDYFIANSSFEYGPGVPIHTSKDLVNWTFAGHALPTRQHMNIEGMKDSMGIFAPTIRHHNGKFYMITTLTDGKWQVLVTADNVAGPWSEPVRVELFGIDPDLFWDTDGRCFMTYASLPLNGIGQVEINTATGEVIGEPYLVWRGLGGKFPEGPHIYQIGDWYYLLIAEGGTEKGHAVSVARSKNIAGPFEGDPQGVMLSNRGTGFAVQSTGHADLVQRPDSSWAMVFHGTRPKGSSPEWHILGRETFAMEIDWIDGWPRIGAPIEPDADPVVIEQLDESSELPVEWISPGGWPSELVTKSTAGLVFAGFAARRQTTQHFELSAVVAGDGPRGIGVGIDGRHHLGFMLWGNTVKATWTIGDHRMDIGELEVGDRSFEFVLRSVEMAGGFHEPVGPDKLHCLVRFEDGKEVVVAALDGRYISTEVAGGMTGRVIGVLAFESAVLKKWNYQSK